MAFSLLLIKFPRWQAITDYDTAVAMGDSSLETRRLHAIALSQVHLRQ